MGKFARMSPLALSRLSDDAFRSLAAQVIDVQQADRRECQILYYRPASEAAEKVHYGSAWTGLWGGRAW